MNISDILRWKASATTAEVFTIAPDAPVRAFVDALAQHDVGALVVVESRADGGPTSVVGVVSERDVVRRLGSDGPGILDQPVRQIMTSEVVTCTSADSIDSIAETMTARRIRHMPVLDGGGRLAGIVSIGDVVSHRMRQLEKDRGQLEQYISG